MPQRGVRVRRDQRQRERWLDGSPPVPTLVVDGVAHVLQHRVSRNATGLRTPPPSVTRCRSHGTSTRSRRLVGARHDDAVESPQPIPVFGHRRSRSRSTRRSESKPCSSRSRPGGSTGLEARHRRDRRPGVVAYEASIVATIDDRAKSWLSSGRSPRPGAFVLKNERRFMRSRAAGADTARRARLGRPPRGPTAARRTALPAGDHTGRRARPSGAEARPRAPLRHATAEGDLLRLAPASR